MIRPYVSALCQSQIAVWVAFTLVLTGAFLALTVPDLGRYPRVHGDESWVMSASYKLATTGVFGSDMYAGFFGADQHYFIAPPVHPLLQALSFTLFGAGIAQARLVSVISAVVVLWAATWLALRWYGLLASIVTGGLLILLRANLVDLWPGLPLLSVGRSGRYDMTAVAFTWLAIVFLDLTIQRRTRHSWPAYASGVCTGLATLSQFFGVFSIIVVAAMLLWRDGRRMLSRDAAVRIGAGWAAVVLPYLAYVGLHWSDYRGQSALIAGRTDFQHPTFYLDNLRDETARYQHLVDPDRMFSSGAGNWLFVIAIWPAVGWLIWRSRQPDRTGDRLLLTMLAVCGVALALIDSKNVPIYAIALWPGCCIAIAAAAAASVTWMRHQFAKHPSTFQRLLLVAGFAITLATGGLLVADGVDAYRADRQPARNVSDYEQVAGRLDATLPAQAGVIGHQRWWWGLHERDYLALNVLQLAWKRQTDASGQSPSFAELFEATGASALIIDDNARSEISRYPAGLRQQIEAFLATGMKQVAVITDPTYGQFEVYVLP